MIFKLKHFIKYPAQIYKYRRFLEGSQRWDPETLDKWRQKKLLLTLQHAFTHVNYYRRLSDNLKIDWKSIKDFSDLKNVSFLRREDIVDNYDDLIADNADQFDPVRSETSGSTGTPMPFLLDKNTNILEFASLWRVLNWAGYKFGDRFVNLHGQILKKDRLWEYDWRTNCLHLSSFNFKQKNIKKYMDYIDFFKPVVIKGYPSSLGLFAQWLKEEKINIYNFKSVITCSETLHDHIKDVIRDAFNCPIYSFYGQNERAALISTCPEGRYHIHQEYSHVEILNEKDEPVNPGETGEIVATTFYNYAMPFIRYRTGDLAVLSEEPCSCGLIYPTINRIVGRIADIVVTPDGCHVGHMAQAFKYNKGIRISQIIQNSTDLIIVKIVPKKLYNQEEEENTLIYHIRQRLGSQIKIKFEYVEQIPAEKNGKIKFVISNVAPLNEQSIH